MWSQIDAMKEMRWGRWPNRFRFPAIRPVDRHLGNQCNRALFRPNSRVNVRGLRHRAETVFELVEQFSGRKVERIG